MIDPSDLAEWNGRIKRSKVAYRSAITFPDNDRRHGTNAGYTRHQRAGTEACEPCRAAHTRYTKQWKLAHLDGSRELVPVRGTQRRIQALCRIGWPMRIIAAESGVGKGSVSRIAAGYPERVRQPVADAIARVYDHRSGTPGPSREAVRQATARGWAAPLSWDDIDRDDRARWVARAA